MAVRVEGLNRLLRDLQAFGTDVEELKDGMSAIAQEGAHVMAGFTPRKSGALHATVRGNRAKARAVVTAGRARVPYAGPINYGWKKRNIRPANFTGKTDEVMNVKAPQMLEASISNLIEKRNLA